MWDQFRRHSETGLWQHWGSLRLQENIFDVGKHHGGIRFFAGGGVETGEESIKLNLDFKKDKDTLRIVCSDACTCDSKMAHAPKHWLEEDTCQCSGGGSSQHVN